MPPKQFWTKVLKVTLVLLIIGGIIYSIFLAISSKLWLVAPLGWILTFFAAAPIGTLIEISENTAARIELDNIEIEDQQDDNPLITDLSNPSITVQQTANKEAAVNTVESQKNKRDYWICSACGEENDLKTTICKKCEHKIWICPYCGEANNTDEVFCKKCNQQIWICPDCGEANTFDVLFCQKCDWQT